MPPMHNLTSKLAPGADARAIENKHPRHKREQQAYAAEEAAGAAEAEPCV